MRHDDGIGPREDFRKPYRKGALSKQRRLLPKDCDFGDVIQYHDGTVAVVTADFSGKTWGRLLAHGKEGEFRCLHELPITLLRSTR